MHFLPVCKQNQFIITVCFIVLMQTKSVIIIVCFHCFDAEINAHCLQIDCTSNIVRTAHKLLKVSKIDVLESRKFL